MSPMRLRFDAANDEELDRVVEVLEEFVSPVRRARMAAALEARTRELVVVLEDIYDEHNASAVLRTADAFGIHEVHVVERKVRFVLQPKTSLGAHKWLDVQRHRDAGEAYAALRARGYQVWASSVREGSIPIGALDPSGPVALVFGNEHEGLSEQAVEAAHARFQVPMVGFVESLNVSVATAVAMYDVLARKRSSGRAIGLERLEKRRLYAEWLALSVRGARPILERRGVAGSAVVSPFPVRIGPSPSGRAPRPR